MKTTNLFKKLSGNPLLLAGALAVTFSFIFPSLSLKLKPLSEAFIFTLKVFAVPLVCFSISSTLLRTAASRLSSLLPKTFLYFLSTSLLACLISILAVWSFDFSNGVDYQPNNFKASPLSWSQFQKSLFTFDPISFLRGDDFLQAIFFSIIFSFAIRLLPQPIQKPIASKIHWAQAYLLKGFQLFLKILPIGIFLIIVTSLSSSLSALSKNLFQLFALMTITVTIQWFVVIPLFAKLWIDFKPLQFLLKMKKPLILALSSASSYATLPTTIITLKGDPSIDDDCAELIPTLGSTINMDGSVIIQTVVYLVTAQFAGIHFDPHQYFILITSALLSSVGTSGIPGGGIAVVFLMHSLLGLPTTFLGIFLLLDRFWDHPLTALNVWGDLVGTKVISQSLQGGVNSNN